MHLPIYILFFFPHPFLPLLIHHLASHSLLLFFLELHQLPLSFANFDLFMKTASSTDDVVFQFTVHHILLALWALRSLASTVSKMLIVLVTSNAKVTIETRLGFHLANT